MAPLNSTSLYFTLLFPYTSLYLHESTSFYHASSLILSPYLTLVHFTIALLHSTWINFILPCLYFTQLVSLYLTLVHFTNIYTSLHLNQLHSIMHDGSRSLHLTVSSYYGSTSHYHCSTSFCLNLLYSTIGLLHYTWLSTIALCFSVLDSTSFLLSSFYSTLLHSTLALLHSTIVSTSHYLTLFHSTKVLLYWTLHHFIIPRLHYTWI